MNSSFGKVFLNVHECKDLDVSSYSSSLGKISPYIEVSCGSDRFSTPVAREQGFNPKFTGASFIFNITNKNDVIHLVVLANELGSGSKLGWLDLPINNLLTCRGPTWYDLHTASDFSNFKGKILIEGWIDNADNFSKQQQPMQQSQMLGQRKEQCGCGQKGCDSCAGVGQKGMGQMQGQQCGCGQKGCDSCAGVGQQGMGKMQGQQCGCGQNGCDSCAGQQWMGKMQGKMQGQQCGCGQKGCDSCAGQQWTGQAQGQQGQQCGDACVGQKGQCETAIGQQQPMQSSRMYGQQKGQCGNNGQCK